MTIDADRVMSPVAFAEIERLLATGCYVGGGAIQHAERHSLAIAGQCRSRRLTAYLNGLGGGMYWCRRDDFDAIGGFDERVTTVDDLDFARRLRDHGLRYGPEVRQPSPGAGDDVVPPATSPETPTSSAAEQG